MKTFCYLLLLLFVLSSSLTISAQNAQWLNFTNGDFINDLEFENNFVWIATKGGLVRYDTLTGESVFYNKSNSGLPFNELRSLTIAPDGKKWFASRIGLISYDGNAWGFFAPPSVWLNPIDQFSANKVECDANGNIWTTTDNGHLFKFDGIGQWASFDEDALFGDEVYGLAIDKNDHIWLSRWGTSAFCKFDGTSVVKFDESNTPFPPGFGLNYLTTDEEGEVWICLNNYEGFFHFDGNNWNKAPSQNEWAWAPDAFGVKQHTIYYIGYEGLCRLLPDGSFENTELPSEIWLANYNTYAENLIKFSSNGTLWLATGGGMFTSDLQDFTRIQTTQSALGKNGIQSLSITPPQNVLINWTEKYEEYDFSNGEGLTTFHDGVWQRFSKNNPTGTPDFSNIKAAETDAGGSYWVADAYHPLYRYDGYNWTPFANTALSDPNEFISGIAADPFVPGKLWCRTWKALYKLENGLFDQVDMPDDLGWFGSMATDSEGNLWMAGHNAFSKLWRLKDGQWTSFDTAAMELNEFSAWIKDIETGAAGQVGVVTSGGFSIYDGVGNWKSWHYQNTGNPYPYFASAIAFDGTDKIWIGYFHEGCNAPSLNAGPSLSKIEGNVWTNYYFLSSGMPHPNVSDLVVDAYHNLWIGTDYGGLGIYNENNVVLGANNPPNPATRKTMRIEIAPNPARDAATLTFSLPEQSDLNIQIANSEGKVVETLSQSDVPAGQFAFRWNVEKQPAGVYFFHAITRQGAFVGEIVVQK